MSRALGVTAHIRYVIDPAKLEEFEEYAEEWIRLVPRFGGVHHGYFLPSEGASNVAYALFSFPSLAAYERYRRAADDDPECIAAYELAKSSRCILSYERTFLRPVLSASS
ncbi:MAG: NIPSNAP family protein [Acidobacteriota bacterium]